jgi:hypothetical protein
MDINMHKQLFSPSDFAFQVTESRPKQRLTEMTLIVDVDMNLLKELHEHGSVNT